MQVRNAEAESDLECRWGTRDRQSCDRVEAAVAAAFAVPRAELRAPRRGPAPVAFARQSAMYLAHVALGLSLTRVGRHFGRDRTTAAHACRLVEERRDDPTIDAVLSSLEEVCGGFSRPDGALPETRQ